MYRVSQARNALPTIAPYVISAGDILGLSVLQDLKLFDDILVQPDGNVTLPLVNSVRAAGLTLAQFRAEVASKFDLGPRYVLVMLKQSSNPRVVVAGQVKMPGQYPMTDKLTLPNLVTQAGGLTDLADNGVVVLRPSKYVGGGPGAESTMVIAMDFVDVQKGVKQFELMSGDVIYFN